jgi:hypothetical protein
MDIRFFMDQRTRRSGGCVDLCYDEISHIMIAGSEIRMPSGVISMRNREVREGPLAGEFPDCQLIEFR